MLFVVVRVRDITPALLPPVIPTVALTTSPQHGVCVARYATHTAVVLVLSSHLSVTDSSTVLTLHRHRTQRPGTRSLRSFPEWPGAHPRELTCAAVMAHGLEVAGCAAQETSLGCAAAPEVPWLFGSLYCATYSVLSATQTERSSTTRFVIVISVIVPVAPMPWDSRRRTHRRTAGASWTLRPTGPSGPR